MDRVGHSWIELDTVGHSWIELDTVGHSWFTCMDWLVAGVAPRQSRSVGARPQAARVSGIQLGTRPRTAWGQLDPTGRQPPRQSRSVGARPHAVRVSGIQLGTRPQAVRGQWDPTGPTGPTGPAPGGGPCSPTGHPNRGGQPRAHASPCRSSWGPTVTSGMNSIQLATPATSQSM